MICAGQQQVLYNYYTLQYYLYLLSMINPINAYAYPQTTPRPQPHTFTQKAKPEPLKIVNLTQNVSKPEPLKEQKRQPQTISRPQTPVEIKQQNPPQDLEKETEKLVKAFENLSVDAPPTGYQDNQEYEIYETDEEKLLKDPFSSGEEEQAPIPIIEIEDSEDEDEAVVLDFEPISEAKPHPISTSTNLEDIVKPRGPKEPFYDSSSDDGDEENAIPAYAVVGHILINYNILFN